MKSYDIFTRTGARIGLVFAARPLLALRRAHRYNYGGRYKEGRYRIWYVTQTR